MASAPIYIDAAGLGLSLTSGRFRDFLGMRLFCRLMPLRTPISILCVFAWAVTNSVFAAPAGNVSAALRGDVSSSPQNAPKILANALRAAGPEAAGQAARLTTAAIQGLGPNATAKQIGNIVFAAVRAVPGSVLEITRAAVLASPNADAPEIVSAAVSASPNPWKEVTYHRYIPPPDKGDAKDDKAVERMEEPGKTMTLAEAIVQTALDSRSGLDAAGLQAAADLALIGDPGYLLHAMYDPRATTAVGDIGLSNYGNEPVLPPTPPPPRRRRRFRR